MKHVAWMLMASLTLVSMDGIASAQNQRSLATAVQAANTDLESIAKEIALLCSQPGFRGFVRSEIASSKNRESILELESFFDRAAKNGHASPGLQKVKSMAAAARGKAKASGFPLLEKYDLYIPVGAHRAQWKGGDDIVVGYAPATDEKDVKEIVAFSVKTGQRQILDPVKTPNTVVLLLAPEEHKDHQLSVAPKPTANEKVPAVISREAAARQEKRPTGKESKTPEGNSQFRFPYMVLYDDHEPWYKGDPEIYVVYVQWTGVGWDRQKKMLDYVNAENRQYIVGMPPAGLNYFFDVNGSNQTYVAVWEADGSDMWVVAPLSAAILQIQGADQKAVTVTIAGRSCSYLTHWEDDSVGGCYFYKDWYSWGWNGQGMPVGPGPDAYLNVEKLH